MNDRLDDPITFLKNIASRLNRLFNHHLNTIPQPVALCDILAGEEQALRRAILWFEAKKDGTPPPTDLRLPWEKKSEG